MSRSSISNRKTASPLTGKKSIKGQPKIKPVEEQRKRFRIPKDELAVIDTLKARCAGVGLAVKKSELVRAGLKLLDQLAHTDLQAALKRLQGGASALLDAVQPKAAPAKPKLTPRARKASRPFTAHPTDAAVRVVKKPATAAAAPTPIATPAPMAAKATRRKPAAKVSSPAQPAEAAPKAEVALASKTKRPATKRASKPSIATASAGATPTEVSAVTPDTVA